MPARRGGKKRPKRRVRVAGVIRKALVNPEFRKEDRVALVELKEAIEDIRGALLKLEKNIVMMDCN